MKKFLSLILALAMVACMSVTVFAADGPSGTTILTVEIPDNEPTYTIHIPSDTTLEYGNTDYQLVGEVYVSDVKNLPKDNDYIRWSSVWTDLSNGSHTIPLTGHVKMGDDEFSSRLHSASYWSACAGDASHAPKTWEVYAKVASWEGAVPGTTYTATVTFTFQAFLHS